MRALLSVLAFALPLGLSTAASSDFTTFSGTSFADAWPSTIGSTGAFGRSESGDFDGDGTPDVLLFDGPRPVVLFAPDQFFAPLELAAPAQDGCVVAGGAPGRDAIALVAPAGLSLVRFDPLTGQLSSQLTAAGAWAGARLVRAAQLDGHGAQDVCGIAADRRTVLCLREVASGAPVASATFQALSDVYDVLAIEWDGDAQSELAILSHAGLHIHELDGVLRAGWSSAWPGGAIARVRQAGAVHDRVAWVSAFAPPLQQTLLTVSPSGIESSLGLGALDVVAALGADFDGDGDDDLLLSHRHSHQLLWIENERDITATQAVSFDAFDSAKVLIEVGPVGEQAPQNASWPALADFDGDGDLDIVFAVERTASVHVIRGDWNDETRERVTLDAARYDVEAGQGVLELDLDAPLALPVDATHVEWVLRRRSNVADAVDAIAVAQGNVTVHASWPLSLSLAIPQASLGFADVYDVQMRLVALDSAGARTHVHPTTVGSFTVLPSSATTLAGSADAEFALSVTLLAPAPENSTCATVIVQRNRGSRFRENLPPVCPTPQS